MKQFFKNYWILIVILLVYVALNWPDSLGKSLYSSNELPRDLGILRDMQRGKIILVGPDSCLGNFHFGPVYYYLAYPIVRLLNFAPYSLATASIFFNLLTIIASFYVAEKWWKSRPLSYTVAALMATSIFTFQFSQYGSNPNFLPFFSVLFFYALERLINGSKSLWYAILLGSTFGIATQLHAVPLLCMPLILLYAVLRRQLKVSWKQIVVFLATIIILFTPYLKYELTNNFVNIRALFHIASASGFHTPFSERLIEYLGFWLVPVLSIHNFFDVISITGMNFIYWLALALFVFLVILKFAPKRKITAISFANTPTTVKTTIQYWLIIPSLVILFASSSVNGLRVYYFLMLYPLIFFLFALGILKLIQKGYIISVTYIVILYLVLQGFQMFLYRSEVRHLITWVIK